MREWGGTLRNDTSGSGNVRLCGQRMVVGTVVFRDKKYSLVEGFCLSD